MTTTATARCCVQKPDLSTQGIKNVLNLVDEILKKSPNVEVHVRNTRTGFDQIFNSHGLVGRKDSNTFIPVDDNLRIFASVDEVIGAINENKIILEISEIKKAVKNNKQ